MFFNFFKRESAKPAARPRKAAPRGRAEAEAAVPGLPPEPSTVQVTEGSAHSDWALWEDSVAALDSQMGALQPQVKLYRQEPETPTEFQDIEAFARVRHKDP